MTANEISEKMTAANLSYMRISFDPTVSLHSSSFPSFNWSSYLAALGGTVSLWLGLGIMQLIQMLVDKFEVVKQRLNDVPHSNTNDVFL